MDYFKNAGAEPASQPQTPVKVSENFDEVYLHNDEQGQPLYGFTVRGHTITQFHTYPSFQWQDVQLPQLDLSNDPWAIQHRDVLAAMAEQNGHFTAEFRPTAQPNPVRDAMSSDEWLQNYANGGLTVAKGCFAGYRNLRLKVPTDYSVKLADGCFDQHAKVELVLPNNVDVKCLEYSYATDQERGSEKWLLLAHRDFHYNRVQQDPDRFAVYATHNYQRRDRETQIFVSHLPQRKLTTCTVQPYQLLTEIKVDDWFNPQNKSVYLQNPTRER